MLWRVLASVVPLILLAYLAVIDFADLFPWNDIAAVPRRERAREAALNYPPLLIAAIGFALDNDLMRIVALVMVCAYTIGNALAWWVPYLIGASKHQREEYETSFGRTRKSLPSIGDHLVPDNEHLVVSILIWAMLVASTVTIVIES
jgi:hypothetical protein